MSEKLKCEIIQDLLPSYVDGLTSSVTNEVVEMHLLSCDQCKKMHDRMIGKDLEMDSVLDEEKNYNVDHNTLKQKQKYDIQEIEIDFLKKVKKKNGMTMMISMLLIVAAVIVVSAMNTFFIGKNVSEQSISCRVSVDGNILKIEGVLLDSAKGVSDIIFDEENGIVNVVFKEVLASAFYSGDFNTQYIANSQISQVRIGDRILWDQGTEITNKVSDVFNAAHPYIGDMPANGKSCNALDMGMIFGSFTNELHTDAEPYGWTMYLEEIVYDEDYEYKTEMMFKYSMVLLATIDNLSYVTFEYESEHSHESVTFDIDDALSYLNGEDIKTYGDTPVSLQKLMKMLRLE